MKAWIEKLTAHPVIAHWIRTFERFTGRLGFQFAAAITYFSILACVPILMVAFAILGLTLTVVQPDLLETIHSWINGAVAAEGPLADQISPILEEVLGSWRAIGVAGAISALWVGGRWVSRIRAAIRAQMRPDFDMEEDKPNAIVAALVDIVNLLALFALMALTFVLSAISTHAHELLRTWMDLDSIPGGSIVLTLGPLLPSLIVGFVLFCYLFWAFPEKPIPPRTLIMGATLGSIGTAVLQYSTGLLIRVFNNNAAVAVFGGVVVMMLFLNLFATLILMIAAWMATIDVPEENGPLQQLARATRAPTDYATKQLLAELADDHDTVPRPLAVRAVRVGTGVGLAFGATVMLTAASVASWMAGRRERP